MIKILKLIPWIFRYLNAIINDFLLLCSQSEVSYAVISELHKQNVSNISFWCNWSLTLPAFCKLNLYHTRMIIVYRYKKYKYFIVFNSNRYTMIQILTIGSWGEHLAGRVNRYSSRGTSWTSPSDEDSPTSPWRTPAYVW